MQTDQLKQTFASVLNFFKPGKGNKPTTFGTFGGVFTPNVLTILGVIMYLRLGWVVGQVGFVGAAVIILLAKIVTICTGLSMSSITTNIRIGAGGAYSIISKSLGLEAGGSIGIPLYIAQTLSAALYIIGFTEGWLRVFPDHPKLVVSLAAWAVLLVISYTSAQFAIKIQYIIMTIMGLSLVSFFMSPAVPVSNIVWVKSPEGGASFWTVYAIFFPAVTGIMAGANMSGDLKDPRRSIPLGTMSAIGITMIIYLLIALMVAYVATTPELLTNQMVMVDKAWWGPIVVAGIMGATFSSALGSMLGAPRLLQALAEQKTIPVHDWLSTKTASNEPRNAIIVTGGLVALALVTGNLDALAALITMFFLITYGMLNLVVFIQQSMKIISFRPTFKVPRFVPALGAVMCVFMMFLIDPIFSVVALAIIVLIYVWLVRQELQANWGDIRGGMFLILAERATHLADKFPRHQITWKPDLLVPIEDPRLWAGSLLFIRDIVSPSGSIFAFTVETNPDNKPDTENALTELLQPLREQKILTNSVVIEDKSFEHGANLVVQTLRGGSFRPNLLFLTMSHSSAGSAANGKKSTRRSRATKPTDDIINELVKLTLKHEMGAVILRQHPRMAFGMQKDVNLWLRDKTSNWHLAVLVALHLQLNWDGKINLLTADAESGSRRRLTNFLERLSDLARLPSTTELRVITASFEQALETAPRADVNIFGLSLTPSNDLPLDFIRRVSEQARSSCVFVIDSGRESALV
ncbi:MAG: hypothetical protein FOGNACKC_04661 [Anaerolineae bacterium]|nr:hypothetical protein [Anaerolineae bacterium]